MSETPQSQTPQPQKTMIKSLEDKTSYGEIIIVDLDTKPRLKSALKISGILLGLAVVTAFIPILHFVLVPGFLLASIIAFVMTFSVKKEVTQHVTTCPQCNEALSLKGQDAKFPMRLVCRGCHTTNYMELVAQ